MTTRTSGARSVSSSLRDLRRVAQPPEFSPGRLDGLYRAGSIFLSAPLARLGATPNGVTVAWILIGLGGVAALLSPLWTVRIAGGLLLQLSYLLDFVDGEVARLRRQSSPVGNFLDLVGHGLIKVSLPLGAGWAAAADRGGLAWLLAGGVGALAVGVGDSLRFYAAVTAGDLASGDLARVATGARHRPGMFRRARAAFHFSFESPALYALALLGAAAGRLDAVVLYWALGGTVWFLVRAVRYSRRLPAAGAPAAPAA